MHQPSTNLFDKIIAAIEQEKQLRHGKNILLAFAFFLFGSAALAPFSLSLFVAAWRISGTYYFIESALFHAGFAVRAWQVFFLAATESFPFMPMVLLIINIACLLFALRLFLHRQGLLLNYLKHLV